MQTLFHRVVNWSKRPNRIVILSSRASNRHIELDSFKSSCWARQLQIFGLSFSMNSFWGVQESRDISLYSFKSFLGSRGPEALTKAIFEFSRNFFKFSRICQLFFRGPNVQRFSLFIQLFFSGSRRPEAYNYAILRDSFICKARRLKLCMWSLLNLKSVMGYVRSASMTSEAAK